jgi:hypothetical protein
MKRQRQNAAFSKISLLIISAIAILLVMAYCSSDRAVDNCKTYAEAAGRSGS